MEKTISIDLVSTQKPEEPRLLFGCGVKSVRIGFFHVSHSGIYFVNALVFNGKAVVERRGFRPKIFDDQSERTRFERQGNVLAISPKQSSYPLLIQRLLSQYRSPQSCRDCLPRLGGAHRYCKVSIQI